MLNLEFARRQQRRTQADVSSAARISQPFLSDIERGKAWPTPDQRERIARILSIPPEELLDEVRPETKATEPQEAVG